jgi:Cd2+/Zn2+-exporting ATPase
MTPTIKKELILDNLDCAHCAAQIEQQVQGLKDVTQASMNFATKTLTVEILPTIGFEQVLKDTNQIIKKLEPDVNVREKHLVMAPEKKTLILEGLDCANCAAKIERAVQDIDGVSSASVDFASRKLVFEINRRFAIAQIVQEVADTAVRVESGIKVVEPEQVKPVEEPEEIIERAKMVRLGLGVVFYAAALITSFTGWLDLSIYLASYLLIGWDVLLKAAKNILRGQVFDENFLMGIATVGAFAIQAYPEAVAVMLFYEVGEFFEKMAVGHSRRSISALMDIRPDYANLKAGDEIRKISPDQVRVGELIVVKPGEKIPLDGRVAEGTSLIDTAAITGESIPRTVKPGDAVYSGSINKNGLFTVEVTKVFGESTVSKILDLVQNASSKKAPTEKFITRFAHFYTPAVVFFALAMAVIPPLVVPGATFTDWVYRALIFLVVSCPCALVISIPLGYFGGIGGASRHGILVKGSNYLEALKNVDTVVFDKTGTLTQGVFKVTKIKNMIGSEQNLLELAAYAESYSNHPIAQSILNAYGREIMKERISDYDEIPGFGIKAIIGGKTILAGNARFMLAEEITASDPAETGTVVHLAVNKSYMGYLVISDELKADAAQAIKRLKAIGVKKTVMLTGDSRLVGEQIGNQLGLDEIHAELLPDQKVSQVEQIEKSRSTKGKLVFVGDGINDAPVLARSDVGIAMGGLGSDAAIEAADIVIMTDQPSKVAQAILLARKTNSIVKQNIIFAFAVKAAVLIMSAGGVATMWEAVFADMGVALIAIFNALRVLNGRKME